MYAPGVAGRAPMERTLIIRITPETMSDWRQQARVAVESMDAGQLFHFLHRKRNSVARFRVRCCSHCASSFIAQPKARFCSARCRGAAMRSRGKGAGARRADAAECISVDDIVRSVLGPVGPPESEGPNSIPNVDEAERRAAVRADIISRAGGRSATILSTRGTN